MQSGFRSLGVDPYYLRLLRLPFLLRYINPSFLYSTLHHLQAQPVNSSVIILSLSFIFVILHLFTFFFTPALFLASKLHIFLNPIIQHLQSPPAWASLITTLRRPSPPQISLPPIPLACLLATSAFSEIPSGTTEWRKPDRFWDFWLNFYWKIHRKWL